MTASEDQIPDEAVRLAMASRAYDLIDLPDPMVLSDERLTRRMLAAAAPLMIPADLREALNSVRSCIATSARDMGEYRVDAWLYAVLVGWDCEEQHVHDDLCGGDGAMRELATRHGWSPEEVSRARRLRRAVAAATRESDVRA